MLSSFWLHSLLLQMIFIIFYTTIIWNIQIGVDTNFFVANSRHFVKNVFSQIHDFFFFWEKTTKNSKNATKITTTTYNWNKCLIFLIFIFWIVPNLAKHNYGLRSLEHYHKIEKKIKMVAIPHFLQHYNYLSPRCQLLIACIVCNS